MTRYVKLLICLLCLCFSMRAAPQTKVVTYYYTDHAGSVLAVTDASGAIIASREYRPYGAPFIAQGDMERSFGGHVEDSEVGLVYMQARFYDPQVGRFLSIDPFDLREDEVRQAGHYHFGLNNPLSYTEPTGMSACSMFEALKCNADGGERRMQDGRALPREWRPHE